jgi:hypothetical protein
MLGAAYAEGGRVPHGLALLERGVESAAAMKLAFGRSLLVGLHGEACLHAGRADAAAIAANALDLAKRHGERGSEAWSHRLLGAIAAQRDPPDVAAAADAYERGVALAQQLGMAPLVARYHLDLGVLHGRTGKPTAAREHLEHAAAQFRAMEMPAWLERARTALGAVG